jgi:bacillithiol system protein YtxJ
MCDITKGRVSEVKTRISSVEEFDKKVKETKDFLIIKHSLTCPISTAAFEEYEKFESDHQDVKTYYLFVQDDRVLSNHIAETYSVKHESPQALRFRDGQVVWNASHWNITYDSLSEEVKK